MRLRRAGGTSSRSLAGSWKRAAWQRRPSRPSMSHMSHGTRRPGSVRTRRGATGPGRVLTANGSPPPGQRSFSPARRCKACRASGGRLGRSGRVPARRHANGPRREPPHRAVHDPCSRCRSRRCARSTASSGFFAHQRSPDPRFARLTFDAAATTCRVGPAKRTGRATCPRCGGEYRVWTNMVSRAPKLPRHGPRGGPRCQASGWPVSPQSVRWDVR